MKTVIKYNKLCEEYTVTLFKNGKKVENATYYTDSLKDAKRTAKAMKGEK